MRKKVTSKLNLHKETLLNLSRVIGGQAEAGAVSDGPAKCLISECRPCLADRLEPAHPAEPAPEQGIVGDAAIAPRP